MTMLSIDELRFLHDLAIKRFGGKPGVRDESLLLSALGQPNQTFGGQDLYPDWVSKCSALAFFLISNHGFHDGNKRVGFAVLELCLRRGNCNLTLSDEEIEPVILGVADGTVSRAEFENWVRMSVAATV